MCAQTRTKLSSLLASLLSAIVLFSCVCELNAAAIGSAAASQDLANAIVNAMAGSPSHMTNNIKKVNAPEIVSELTPQEMQTISVIMQTMLPSMFGLFSNITSDAFKANFKDPCRFDVLMDIFKNLPPYFDIIAQKYPGRHDLIAYYSMQLASSFLVNNGSLTMACMYNMLSLQTKLFTFSIDIMDNPEKNPELVGKFGIFMKPVMSMLKKNSMMKIIEHVDRYDKNDDMGTIPLFHFLNFVYVFLGVFAILSNILLVILLKKSGSARLYRPSMHSMRTFSSNAKNKMIENNNTLTRKSASAHATVRDVAGDSKIKRIPAINTTAASSTSALKSSSTTAIMQKHKRRTRKTNRHSHKLHKSSSTTAGNKYRVIKSNNSRMFYMIRKRYKTRFCFIVIALCHSFYLLVNFMIMSQASLAAAALKGLTQFNLACKMAFFMSPPDTFYNIVHQLAIWLLVYAIREHAIKLRKTKTTNSDSADSKIEMISEDDFDDDDDDDDHEYHSDDDMKVIESDYEKELYAFSGSEHDDDDDDEETVSVSLTNNSTNFMMSQSGGLVSSTITSTNQPGSVVKFKISPDAPSYSNYHQILKYQRRPIIQFTPTPTPNTVVLPQLPTAAGNQHTTSKLTPPIISPDGLIPASQQAIKKRNNHNSNTKKNTSFLTFYCCYLFSHKRRNVLFGLILFMLICVYDSQNFFLYSLFKVTDKQENTLYFCAFESNYSDYYTMLTQYVLPISNLFLFSFLPLLLCTMQVLFDACFLVRMQREQMKRYDRLKEVIEWPLYAYYAMYMLSQSPLALHQIIDLASGTIKFPFVFPIFIQLKFTSRVWLNVIELTLIFICYSSDLYIWMLCDKQMRRLAAYWLNKRIFCRTYNQKEKKPTNPNASSKSGGHRRNGSHVMCGASSSSGNIDGSTSVGSSHSTSSSEGFSCNRSDSSGAGDQHMNATSGKKETKNRIYKKQPQQQQQQQVKSNATKQMKSLDLDNQNIHMSGTSTVSSSASSSSNLNKKQISPIIAAAADTVAATARAAAAISASMSQQPAQKFNETATNSGAPKRIHMIDTDNDDIDDIIDLDGQNQKLSKLYEEKELDSSTLHRAYVDKPPSFNTAVRGKNDKRAAAANPYQNVIDITQINDQQQKLNGSD